MSKRKTPPFAELAELVSSHYAEPERAAEELLARLCETAGAYLGTLLVRRRDQLEELARYPSDATYFPAGEKIPIEVWNDAPEHEQTVAGHVAATKQEQIIDDVSEKHWRGRRFHASDETKSECVCPILVGKGELLGVVCLAARARNHFQEAGRVEKIRATLPLAGMVLLQSHDAQLQDDKRQYSVKLAELSGRSIIQESLTSDLTDLYAECFQRLYDLIPCEAASIWMESPDARYLVLRAYDGDERWDRIGHPKRLPNDPRKVLIARALRDDTAVYSPRAADTALYREVSSDVYGDCQFLAVPMRMGRLGARGVFLMFVSPVLANLGRLRGDIALIVGELANFLDRVQLQRVISASRRAARFINDLATKTSLLRHAGSLPSPEIDASLTSYCREMGYGEIAFYVATAEGTARLAAQSHVHASANSIPQELDTTMRRPMIRTLNDLQTVRTANVLEDWPGSWPADVARAAQGEGNGESPFCWDALISVPIPSTEPLNRGAVVVFGKQPHVRGMYTFFDKHDEGQIATIGAALAQLHAVALTRQRELVTTTMVGHEVRNVLTTLSYALETVYSKVKPEFRDRVKITRTNISEQINLLVFLAHNDDLIGNPNWELKEETVGLHGDVIAPIAGMMQAFGGHKGITIKYDDFIRLRVPRFRLDKHRMEQVIYNLLSNAVKYGDRFSTVEITYCGARDLGAVDESQMCFAFGVRNRGPGLREDERERVFLLHERGSAAPRASLEGQGKGLTVARMIMRKHGGDVWFEALGGANQWTEVCFRIPADRAVRGS